MRRSDKTLIELRETLLEVVRQKPELRQGIESLLGVGKTAPNKRETNKEIQERLKRMYTAKHLRQVIKESQ